jgi:endonuclease III
MPATVNKQRILNQLVGPQTKGAEPPPAETLPVLEQFIYAICREGTTRDRADRAFRRLRTDFFDWNEVRVSSTRELEEALRDLPDPEVKAQRLVTFLQEVFETTFSFDLEGLHKKGLKQAAKALSRYQAANDFVCAWVVQHSLGGHAIPLDQPMLRALRRLGLLEGDGDDLEAVRASLEHLVPKARGLQFTEALSRVAADVCYEESPACGSCPLAGECATGQDAVRDTTPPSRAPRPKSR